MDLEAHSTPSPSKTSPAAGDVPPHPRLKLHRAFTSRFLPAERNIIVYLPPGYDLQPERTYPVLYMQDGQNLFDERTSYIPGRTWKMLEHADAAIEAGEVEPLDHRRCLQHRRAARGRVHSEPDWQMGGGEAAAYGRLHDRGTHAAHRHATTARRTEREHTGVGGSSLGGLVIALSRPAPPRAGSESSPCFRPASGGTTKASLAISTSTPLKSGSGPASGSISATRRATKCRKRRATQPPAEGQRLAARRNAAL